MFIRIEGDICFILAKTGNTASKAAEFFFLKIGMLFSLEFMLKITIEIIFKILFKIMVKITFRIILKITFKITLKNAIRIIHAQNRVLNHVKKIK